MFKLSKNIFIVFFICTIFPLLLLFVLHSFKTTNSIQKLEKTFLDAGYKQLKQASDGYLTKRKDYISDLIHYLPNNSLTTEQYKHILQVDKVYLVNSNNKINENINTFTPLNKVDFKKIKKKIAFYDLVRFSKNSKPEVVAIFYIPLNNSINKGLLIIEHVDFNKFYPQGPFSLEVYSGERIETNNILIKINDSFAPKKLLKRINFKTNPKKSLEKQNFKIIKLTNDLSKETVCTIVLRTELLQPPPVEGLIQLISLIILVISILLSIYVTYYIKQNFITPFLLISTASKKALSGDFSSYINYTSKNQETSETINRFNEMLEGLEEKENLRNNFITCLTHDLRTPLIANERGIELLISDFEALGLTEQLKLANGMYNNNKLLLRMVNLLIESYHFDSGSIEIQISDINIKELINDCYENLKSLTIDKNITLINQVSDDIAVIKADKDSLKRVFLNLICNSINNLQKDGKICIYAERTNNAIKIIVEDNGPGISEEDQEFLFKKYYISQSCKRQLGAGLGLYICQKLIELNNGRITVDSQVSKYTKFIISLPQ